MRDIDGGSAGTVLLGGGARERLLSRGMAFWLLGGIMGLLLVASSLPSPMYLIYQARWHFSATVLTGVFAVYAVAVLIALLLFGALSDHVGRRPVLIASLVVLIVTMGLFAAAQNIAWLFIARAIQGLATGAATSALSAGLIEMHPAGDTRRATLVNSSAPPFGMAAGGLLAGALVQYGPWPTVFPYLLLVGIALLALVGVLAMPETVTRRAGGIRRGLRPRRIAVPAGIRRPFLLAATSIVASWSIGGLYLSLGPSLAAGLLQSTSHLTGGLVVCSFAGVGGLAQLWLNRWESRRAMFVGSLILIAGLGVVIYGLAVTSTALFFLGTMVVGFGWGTSFMGAFRMVSSLAPAAQRAEVIAAIYVIAYLGFSVPAVAAGIAVTYLGLHATMVLFSGIVAALAAVAGLAAAAPRAAAVPTPLSLNNPTESAKLLGVSCNARGAVE